MRDLTVLVLLSLLLSLLPGVARSQAVDASRLDASLLVYEGCEKPGNSQAGGAVRVIGTIVEGRIGKGVLIERRTLNLVKDPDFVSFENWIAIGRPRRLSRGGHVNASCAAVGKSGYVRQVIEGLAPGTLYCLSAYARAVDAGATLEMRVDRNPSRTYTLSRRFERVVLPFSAAHDLSTITLRGIGDGEILIDGVQLEARRDYPSTFLARGRRNVQRIDIRVGPRTLDSRAGTVLMWFKPRWIGRTSQSGQSLFGWGDRDNPGPYHLIASVHPLGDVQDHDWKNKVLLLRTAKTRHAVGGVACAPISPRWRPNTWHHMAATWRVNPDGLSRMALYLDGELVSEKPVVWGENRPPSTFTVGSWGGGYADGVIDEVYVFDRPLSAREVSFIHELRTPLVRSGAGRR